MFAALLLTLAVHGAAAVKRLEPVSAPIQPKAGRTVSDAVPTGQTRSVAGPSGTALTSLSDAGLKSVISEGALEAAPRIQASDLAAERGAPVRHGEVSTRAQERAAERPSGMAARVNAAVARGRAAAAAAFADRSAGPIGAVSEPRRSLTARDIEHNSRIQADLARSRQRRLDREERERRLPDIEAFLRELPARRPAPNPAKGSAGLIGAGELLNVTAANLSFGLTNLIDRLDAFLMELRLEPEAPGTVHRTGADAVFREVADRAGVDVPLSFVDSREPAFIEGQIAAGQRSAEVRIGAVVAGLTLGELAWVSAHEAAHAVNGDLFKSPWWNRASATATLGLPILLGAALMLLPGPVWLLMGASILLGFILKGLSRALDGWGWRMREFKADAFATDMIGAEWGIAALAKIDAYLRRRRFPRRDPRHPSASKRIKAIRKRSRD